VVEHAFDDQGCSEFATTLATVAGFARKLVRYRCTACGNLTRFDVVTTRRSRAFHHYTVGGELTVEDEEVLAESVEDVSCRWCGTGNSVEVLSEDAPSVEDITT
jgi:hypothetical protein